MGRSKPSSKQRLRSPKRPNLKASPVSKSFLGGKNLVAALCILLAALTIALYSPVMGHSFVLLDDREYVTANAHIRGLGWDTVKWAFTTTAAANWHPLTWLSHAIDYRLFALNPAGHHFDSVLIHALNTLLLFLLLYWATKRTGPSLLVAALFAVHPINVESVAWIAERKNVLSTFFVLLVLVAYGWYAQRPSWRRYLMVAAVFATSLMAKPMGVTLPFVLLLLDYWPLERMSFDAIPGKPANASGAQPAKFSRLMLEKVPLLFFSAASSWITLKAQRAVVQSFEEFSLANRTQNALVSYGLYLWKMIWPSQLAFYPHAIGALPAWQWILSALIVISITVFVIVFRGKRYLPVGWFWFLGTLVPVIGLVQVGEYAMADRYAYVPLIGIFIMIVWGLADWAETKHVRAAWGVTAAVCIVAALSMVTVHQIGYWDSDYDLDSHMLEVMESPFAHNAVGMTLMNPGAAMTHHDLEKFPSEPDRIDEARRHFERAIELQKSRQGTNSSLWDMAGTLNNLGNLDRMQNRLDDARAHDEAALKIYRQLAQQNPEVYLPYLAVTLNNLGSANRLQNHLDEARQDYEESLKINRQLAKQDPAKYLPNVAMILNEYGLADASQHQTQAAREHYEEALKIDRQLAEQSPAVYLPQLAMTLSNFALFEAFQHRLEEARFHYEEALKIDRQLVEQNSAVYLPDLAMTLGNLGKVNQLQGRIEESRDNYEEAYNLLQKLMQGNSAYAGEMARIEASLQDLEHIPPSQHTPARALQTSAR
jgi:tetratricopeptide (TPR) repeat protein